MKVLIVNPALSKEELKNPVVSNLFSNAMPLGICYLASMLLKEGIHVELIDGAAERIEQKDIIDRCRKGNFDILGISTTTVSFHRAVELGDLAKKAFGDSIPILVGGPHMSALPQETMKEKCFDIGVLGEAEGTIVELVRTLEQKGDLSRVLGIYYREGDELIFTGPRPLIQDIDTIPFPARHLLNPKLYSSLPTDVKRLPKFSILANRGCPFQCIFCDSAVVGKKYRSPSPKYLADEVEHVIKEFGAKEIFFVGTTFTASRKATEDFLDELESRNLKFSWTCSTRVDVVDKPLLERMKRDGCWSIRFGVESGNQEVLNFIKKGITKEQVHRAISLCNEVGIHTKGFFMIGHLVDTHETIVDTINFAKELPLTDVTVQINTPLPNTEQYNLAKDYGTLMEKDYVRFSFFDPVFVPKGLTEEDLVKYHRRFYREFYWRPEILLRQFGKVLNFNTFFNYIKCANLIIYLTLKK
ncbi:MAG: B12-binding domain-containing radical SAM protein [Firmicutes bacterium]|nr:B12-binding domain-containing radical SAM protein [Bacillota bacterium]